MITRTSQRLGIGWAKCHHLNEACTSCVSTQPGLRTAGPYSPIHPTQMTKISAQISFLPELSSLLGFLDNIWNSCLPDFFSLLFFLNNMFLMLWESFSFNFRLINSNYLGLIMSSSGPSAHQHIIFDLSCEELMGHGEIFS